MRRTLHSFFHTVKTEAEAQKMVADENKAHPNRKKKAFYTTVDKHTFSVCYWRF